MRILPPERPFGRAGLAPSIFTLVRTPFVQVPQKRATFETWMGVAITSICPFSFDFFGLRRFLTSPTPSTIIRPVSVITRRTLLFLPLSLPLLTITVSPFLILIFVLAIFCYRTSGARDRSEEHTSEL